MSMNGDGNGRDERTTDPSPREDDTLAIMRELRAALERVGELAVKLSNRLTLAEIAILTGEHKDAVLEARVDKLAAIIDSRLGSSP